MRGPRFLSWALPVAIMAAGCAPSLAVREPVVALPVSYESTALTVPDGAADLDLWWRLFDDVQLEELIERALANGTDSRLALARLIEARAIRSGALSRFRVQGDLQTSLTAQRTETLSGDATVLESGAAGAGAGGVQGGAAAAGGDADTVSANFNLSWELDLFGRRAATRRGADADLAAARFLYEGSRAALAADVADALFAARGLAVQLADATESARIQRELRDVLTVRVQRGLAPDADAARVDADLSQAAAQAEQLAAELIATKRALLVLTGAAAASVADLTIEGDLADPPRPPASVPGVLLQRRPDVREAEARFRSAVARTRLQRLELFPRFTLQPGVGLTASRATFDYTIATWTLGLGIAQPLLDRPRLLSELRAQTARADQAAIQYERAVQAAFSEADQALVRLDADRRRVALLTAGERRAGVAYEAKRTLFTRGLNDLQALLDAERTWRSARQALAVARGEALRRAVTSFRALGGGWSLEREPGLRGT